MGFSQANVNLIGENPDRKVGEVYIDSQEMHDFIQALNGKSEGAISALAQDVALGGHDKLRNIQKMRPYQCPTTQKLIFWQESSSKAEVRNATTPINPILDKSF